MCTLLYVKLIWCSGVAWIYDFGGVDLPVNLTGSAKFGVVVFQASMLN